MKANNLSRVALEECAPNVFIVHDIRVRPFLHGEGNYVGNRFVLTSWRRDGLFARIRERGLDVASLDAQIAALPALPVMPPLADAPRWHLLGHDDERWSYYDATTRSIAVCAMASHRERMAVALIPGWVVRRRRGRGAGEWYRTAPQGTDTIQFSRIDEDTAILCGLAQAALHHHAPLPVTVVAPEMVQLVTPVLPQPYQHCAKRWAIGMRDGTTWQLPSTHLDWMHRLLHRLAIAVSPLSAGDTNA
jgi:hypothetical protein